MLAPATFVTVNYRLLTRNWGMQEKNTSLADLIIDAGNRAKGPARENLRALGRKLFIHPLKPHLAIKRFVYDDKVARILEKLSAIPFEEFSAQHKRILLPYDTFWIETAVAPPRLSGPKEVEIRKGFLIRKEGNDIRAQIALEMQIPNFNDSQTAMISSASGGPKIKVLSYRDLFKMHGEHITKDGRLVSSPDMEFIFNESGASVSNTCDNLAQVYSKKRMAQFQTDKADMSCDIYRLLVLVSSLNVETNLTGQPPPAGTSETPPGTLHSIRIDLTPGLRNALFHGNHDEVRELLGWTSVMRHTRTYHTRNGPIKKVIEPHDRRIAAPVDRRGVTRIYTAKAPERVLEAICETPGPFLKGEERHDSSVAIVSASAEPELPTAQPENAERPATGNVFQRLWRKLRL
jgi:hypothetical protein